jgi:ATP-dependent Clp protease adaptor protein ClpS
MGLRTSRGLDSSRPGRYAREFRVPRSGRSCQAGDVTGTLEQLDTDMTTRVASEEPWRTIVWDDPVNLMTYVSYVFRSYFGYPREEAERLMLKVHIEGRAVVATGNREAMERHVEAMHAYGLQATVSRAES